MSRKKMEIKKMVENTKSGKEKEVGKDEQEKVGDEEDGRKD
jgi:hypothetical protein